jgi:hypothetical protein
MIPVRRTSPAIFVTSDPSSPESGSKPLSKKSFIEVPQEAMCLNVVYGQGLDRDFMWEISAHKLISIADWRSDETYFGSEITREALALAHRFADQFGPRSSETK